MSTARWFGARTLVWLLVWVVVSGVLLMYWFDTDPARHGAALGPVGTLVRACHAVTTACLVLGSLVHVGVRLRRHATRHGLWTGSGLWLALAIALVTGWLMTQTWVQARIQAAVPVSSTVAAVVHIAYASILAIVLLGLHVTRWGWRSMLAPWRRLAASALLAGAAVLLPVAAPGDTTPWAGVTAWVALPVAGGWSWPLVLSVALAMAALLVPRRPDDGAPRRPRH